VHSLIAICGYKHQVFEFDLKTQPSEEDFLCSATQTVAKLSQSSGYRRVHYWGFYYRRAYFVRGEKRTISYTFCYIMVPLSAWVPFVIDERHENLASEVIQAVCCYVSAQHKSFAFNNQFWRPNCLASFAVSPVGFAIVHWPSTRERRGSGDGGLLWQDLPA